MISAAAPAQETSPPPTLAQLLVDYLSVHKLRASTAACYQRVVRNYLGDWLSKPISQITASMVQARHTALAKQLAASTANLTMRVLRAIVNFAIANAEEGTVLNNPVTRLSHNRAWYKESRRQGTIPDGKLHQWYKALLSLTEATSRDYLMLLALTGLRKSEAMTSKWTDVDFDERTLRIRAENAKNGREHKLPVSNFLLSMLRRRAMESRRTEYVFPGRTVERLSSVQNSVAEIGKKIEHHFTLHDLRRGFVSAAAKVGIPHHLIKKLVNHADDDVTAGYIIFNVDDLRRPLERVNAHLLRLMQAET